MLGLVVACHNSMQFVVWTTTKRKLREKYGGGGELTINTNSTNYLVDIFKFTRALFVGG
jgi:hypothetical protein